MELYRCECFHTSCVIAGCPVRGSPAFTPHEVVAESVVGEDAMAILSAASDSEDGSKLVYMSTGLAVRLARTPRCVAPDADDFLKGHSVDKLAPDVDGLRVAVAQHVPMYM